MLESVLMMVGMLLVVGVQFAIIGGALAGGAWVVWRYLERRAKQGPPPDAEEVAIR
jgi:uncharacterized protein YneF (UPF0154 family)